MEEQYITAVACRYTSFRVGSIMLQTEWNRVINVSD